MFQVTYWTYSLKQKGQMSVTLFHDVVEARWKQDPHAAHFIQ